MGFIANKKAGKRIATQERSNTLAWSDVNSRLYQAPADMAKSSGNGLNGSVYERAQRGSRHCKIYPRPRENLTQSKPLNPKYAAKLPHHKSIPARRKRSYDDSFIPESRIDSPNRERTWTSRRNRSSPPPDIGIMPAVTLQSSQSTISDENMFPLKAKQFNVSPSHTKERPFRLNLKKRDEIRLADRRPSDNDDIGAIIPDSGSSAMKSLNFDASPPPKEMNRDGVMEQSSRINPEVKNTEKKSWYELTLEEEEEDSGLSPLEDRFNSSIRIEDLRITINSLTTKEKDVSVPLAIDPGLPDVHLKEVEAYAMEWDNNNEKIGCVELEWTEDDEVAYREATNLMKENGDFMEDDDLLGEELGEAEVNDSVGVRGTVSSMPLAGTVSGQTKPKGNKKEPKK